MLMPVTDFKALLAELVLHWFGTNDNLFPPSFFPGNPITLLVLNSILSSFHSPLHKTMADVLTRLDISTLVALFLQSTLYGIYIVTCGNCAVVLTRVNGRWKRRHEIHWIFLIAGTILLANTTCYVFFQLYRCFQLFVLRRGPEGSAVNNDPLTWLNISKVRCNGRCFRDKVELKFTTTLISPYNFSVNRPRQTSLSSTEPLSSIGGSGRSLHYVSSCGLPTPSVSLEVFFFKPVVQSPFYSTSGTTRSGQ